MRTAYSFTIAAALLLTQTALADCDYSASRNVDVDAVGVKKVVVRAGAGDLVVRGSPSGSRVTASGKACAYRPTVLEEIRIDAYREGDTVFVNTTLPEGKSWLDHGSIDLKVGVPRSAAMEIDDSSGDLELSGVGAARVSDSSGDMNIEDIGGDLTVSDSSGDIDIETVRGAVMVRDSSGDMSIEDVTGKVSIPVDSSGGMVLRRIRGDVHIEKDSSGDIRIAEVNQNVLIDDDSSGDIRVSEVAGNFTVGHDTTGDIHHERVLGKVQIPRSSQDD